MATTDLKLDPPGTLPRPGPVGRAVRLGLGLICGYYVFGLVGVIADLITSEGHIRPIVWNGLVPSLFLISYVINLGYSRSWKKWPAIVSAGSFLAIGATSYLIDGNFESQLLAGAILSWELYIFTHLGVAFVIAALIATPGCEMRAFHDLYSLITERAVQEHYCPVGPLHPIDQWEAQHRSDRADW